MGSRTDSVGGGWEGGGTLLLLFAGLVGGTLLGFLARLGQVGLGSALLTSAPGCAAQGLVWYVVCPFVGAPPGCMFLTCCCYTPPLNGVPPLWWLKF